MAFFQFRREQHIKGTINEVWDFISDPHNLKKITPGSMGFDIMSTGLPDQIYEGMIISYTVKPMWGIPTNWVTEITHVEPHRYFVDEQRVGPYALWHHQHFIEPAGQGVRMTDIISYQPPFGVVGRLANMLVIRKKLNQIFTYREEAFDRIFPA